MNGTIEIIQKRRSVRKYKPDQIKEEELMEIIEAGKYAPSAMNQQPWHFTVIQNKEALKKINDVCKEMLMKSNDKNVRERAKAMKEQNANIMYNAPTLVVVSGDEKAIAPVIDCSLAIENMFLAAKALGVGSCWIHALKHLFGSEEGKDFLVNESIVPQGYILVGAAVLGYNDIEEPSSLPRKEGTVTIIR